MNKTLINTALLYLSGGFILIGIYEIATKGLGAAYLWIMIGFMLWMWYGIRRRDQVVSEEKEKNQAEAREKPVKKSAVSKSTNKRR